MKARPVEIACADCGVLVPVGPTGMPPRRCKPCAATRMVEAQKARRKKSTDELRPTEIICQKCGDRVPVSRSGYVPRYCLPCRSGGTPRHKLPAVAPAGTLADLVAAVDSRAAARTARGLLRAAIPRQDWGLVRLAFAELGRVDAPPRLADPA